MPVIDETDPASVASLRETGRRTGTGARTVLVTGASGVVGQALLPRLTERDEVEVVALVHRTPVTGERVTVVRGDVSAPRLGLSATAYDALADRVDAVVHCAAVTDFNRTDGSLEATNVTGRVAEFARDAGAALHHVSTAFVNTTVDGDRGRTAVGYAASKSAAERALADSGVPHVVHRPSVVVGDSRTGEIAAFQGLHQVVAGLFAGMVPMIPFDARWPIDFVPCDLVADAISTVVEAGITEGEYWITAGERALRLDEAIDVTVGYAADLGVHLDTPRFVPPDMFDRLIGPVFLDALPEKIRRSVLRMLEFFATYLQSGATMPSSLDELARLGAMPLPDQVETLSASLHHWAEHTGHCTCAAGEVA
jgi:nucleoside-diphosphate-sugar epimerase